MPKRTNQFQQIVTYIAEQLAPLGARVRESVQVPEGGSSTLREIDTLIEVDAGLTKARIAIESRDRSRKDDVQWIDGLIGKYATLGIDRVLAISSRGFSASARQKAAANNIELLSPEEVAAADWPARFQKLGVASFTGAYDLAQLEFHTTPPFTGPVNLEDQIRHDRPDGSRVEGTVREFIEEIRPLAIARVRDHVSKNLLSVFPTLADLGKTAVVDNSLPASGLTLVACGTEHTIERVGYRVIVRTERTIVPVKHELLGKNSLLTSSQLGDVELVVAQTANASQGKAFVRRAKGKPKKRPKRGKK